MTDQEVFEKLKQGDSAGMEWLYRNKRDAFVHYFMAQKKMSVTEAKELAHDALIALSESAERNSDRPLSAQITTLWIQIGLNKYNTAKRKAAQMPIINWDDFIDAINEEQWIENPFGTTDFEKILQVVESMVNEMEEPCRTLIKAFFWENKPDKEIANIINNSPDFKNKSEAAVKMKRRRCIDDLRQLIFKFSNEQN